ncbi:hypothetical protein F5Y10DRAFT_260322 [Nemania abortiva]|nr:hypothetical protein F5Y10DRAFT_260322 [Nemania abortiva]
MSTCFNSFGSCLRKCTPPQLAGSSQAGSSQAGSSQAGSSQAGSSQVASSQARQQSSVPQSSGQKLSKRVIKKARPNKRPSQDPDDSDSEQPNNSLRLDLPPVTNVYQAFKDLVSRRQSDIIAIANNGGFQLRVATMCSGTEAPIFALKLIKEISQPLANGRRFIEFDHLFSAENEPFKQAYISRNAPGSTVFRDVVDFTDPDAITAPTVLGDHCEIPSNIDLLVAGTSCVDFSTLNCGKISSMRLMSSGADLVAEWKNSDRGGANPKSDESLRGDFFDDFRFWLNGITPAEIQTAEKSMGESSFTFLSTLCYINRHRPKMVIMENVNLAPWDFMCDLFLHAADYAATYKFMDTKNHYIPQTRKRGYVLALDRRVFGSSADEIIREWETQLWGLRRNASAPIHDWLLPSHDPLTMRARQEESEKVIASGLRPGKDSGWERSKLRHARIRRQFRLGNGRPLTAWGLGGIDQPYDRIDRLVLKGQNERALDCIDIYYLRCLHAGAKIALEATEANRTPTGPMQYDIRFKSQIFDLSQNIDRGNINRNFGIAGCVTPRGLNFITDQGRLVSGFEALNLQGLPLRDLDLTGESQDELRDLAGNAMTTTVVGTALLSLLIAVHRHGKDVKPPPLNAITTQDQALIPYQPLYQPSFMQPTPKETWSVAPEPFRNVQEVIDISKRCRRYCYCNGGAKYSAEEIVHCQVCGITRCKSCAGNPKHQFGSSLSIKDPIMNDTTPQEMMEHFPTALTRVINEAINHIPFRPGFHDPALQSFILDSLSSVTFYYTRVLISETVSICYSAKDDDCSFYLQAVISDTWITWYLFLDPWSRCGRLLSKNLGIPAAHMSRPFGRARIYPQASGFVPSRDAWEFWVFTDISFDVGIVKPYPDSIEITNIALENIPVVAHADLRSIIGTYGHHPECDAAEDSLHVCMRGPKRYLFKDPTRIGLTQEDCYIISDECRYLENHEFRDFCVSFPPDWTPQVAGARAKASIKGYWERPAANDAIIHSNPAGNLISYKRQAGFRSIPDGTKLQLDHAGHEVRTLASVQIDSNMLPDTYMTLLKYEHVGPECWAVVSRSDYSALFDLLAPVNVNLGGIESTIPLDDARSCKICCPTLPDVHWMEKITDRTKSSVREPYRISTEMHEYEKELRQCGEPLRVAVNIQDSKTLKEGWKQVTANYEVNIDLLMHRAVGHLPMMVSGSGSVPEVRSSVDIKKGSLHIPNLRFESFRNSLRRELEDIFVGSLEHEIFVDGHVLTEKQEISLRWMLKRELTPPSFTEREIEECRVDPLNLRVLAVAERKISCIGGVLADDVGYGKTIVTLALMETQQKFDQCGSEGDKLALAASLVFVPKHLVSQWREEAAKFLGWKDMDVLVVRSCKDLQGMLGVAESDGGTTPPRPKRPRTAKTAVPLLERLRAAKLIIVSTTVFNDNYYTWLGKYAGSLAPPRCIPMTNSTKDTTNPNVLGAFQDWYEDAAVHARKHLSGFNPNVFNPSRLETIERRQQSLQKSWKAVVADHYDISTRLGLQTATGDKTGKAVKGKGPGVAAATCKEYSSEARASSLTEQDFEAKNFLHVLEAFSFARVVYDEFSYGNFCVAQFVRNAKAHAKWVLSATPPTGNVKAVCGIGDLLKVHVVRPVNLRPGLPLITEGPIVLRENPMEKCLSYGKLSTDKSVYERVEQAHKFLRHFANANPFDEEGLSQIKVLENAYCSYMTRRELVKYLDIQRDLRNYDMDISNILKRHNLDGDAIIESSLEKRLRAGLALTYFASVDSTDDDNATNDKLISSRHRSLEVAQKYLKYISNVAIWLVLRRSKEEVEKKNDSATSAVEDLACNFESILEENAEVLGGKEALEAITNSIFDKNQLEECSRWLKKLGPNERASESYFKDFFELLDEQMGQAAWASYFQLPADRIEGLEHSELIAFIQELDGSDADLPELFTDTQERLEELIADRQESANMRPKQAKNGRKKSSNRKADMQSDHEDAGDNVNDADDDGNFDSSRPAYPRFGYRKETRGGSYTETESELTDIMLKWTHAKDEVIARARQVTTAENLLREDSNRKCSACGQHCNDMRFLPECGHFICSSHLGVRFCGQIKSDTYPDGSGCCSLVHKRSMPASQIDRCPMEAPLMHTVRGKELPKFSSKSRNILHTIDGIVKTEDERVLVFYQFAKQQQEICRLLEYYGIAFETHPGTGATGSAASRNSDKERVRILKINSEEAAGSNYQDANHVIFMSIPVFAKQEDFEKYVKQSKGRAVRYGQLRDVKVYYFVTVNTFEVDLLQLRKRSYIQIEKEDVACFVPMDGNVGGNTNSDEDVTMTDTLESSS